jgi:endonuclease/exonuclease/phosphatase family metal-dependent hydrolase
VTDDQETLRIATWNIHDAIGSDGRRDVERVSQVIGQLNAPLVALQEVSCAGPNGACDVAALGQANGLTWSSVTTRGGGDWQHGNALLSALPVDDVHVHDLSLPRREPRAALEVSVRWGARRLRVVVAHLGLRAGERRHQVERLLSIVGDDRADATILLGDINEWWLWGRPLRWLHRRFGASPAPRTFPSRAPLLSLDRVWVHPRAALDTLTVTRTAVARRASDHLPIVATLRFGPPRAAK